MNAFTASRAYSNVGLESGINTASPHKLISMLYDGAIVALGNAIQHLDAGDIEGRGKAISKAIAIINDGLKIGVNLEEGGGLAQNLWALYDYMTFRLVNAGVEADRAGLEEVEGLLRDLKGAWDSIGTLSVVKPIPVMADEPPPRTAGSYGRV